VNAIQSVSDKSLLSGAVLYVNLEPCSHSGKTPPCADLIIKTGIPEVIIGTTDPNPVVAGNGIRKLKQAGIKVTSGVLADQCMELNRRFFTFHNKKRPYVILKWAQTSNGFIDILRKDRPAKQPTWISNELSRILVHKWRSEEQLILVGTHTALMDNPRLNVREWPGMISFRGVIDRKLVLPGSLNLFDNSCPTLVFNEIKDLTEDQIQYVRLGFDGSILKPMLQYLYSRGILSVFVEGGQNLLNSFIAENLWDEARVFVGTKRFDNGISAPSIDHIAPREYRIREDVLFLYRNQ
jgi:diaminohydroxyphosphoribosylaminopyrimidine deaminase/5-amino-6-(5-phosphoribosylamino)uracil reductase